MSIFYTQHHKSENGVSLNFLPHPLIRHHYLQTIFFNLTRPRRSSHSMLSIAQEMILDTGEVRLQGYYSPQPGGQSKGLVLILHGWLGSANSYYVIKIGNYLYRHGYSIFRLNLRDHGNTNHFNPDLLYDDLLDETFIAAQQIARLESDQSFHMVGGSWGGNLVVRLACRHSQTPLPNLVHTIGISPMLNLYKTILSLDTTPLYRTFFRRKWHRHMRRKKEVCPALHDLSEMMAAPTFMAMIEVFVRHYSTYSDTAAYFTDHTITPEMLAALQSPVTMIAAADDPVIPISDFYPLQNSFPFLKVHIQPYGGHVGYVDLFPFRSWGQQAIRFILESSERTGIN